MKKSQEEKNTSPYMNIFDGLSLIESGPNRGKTDYTLSAENLDVTEPQLRKIIERLKGMYSREPNSTITAIEYIHKVKESEIDIDDIGIGEGKYQAGRKDHSQPYTKENFEFILQKENLKERNDRLKDNVKYNQKAVVSPFRKFSSRNEASKVLEVDVNTISRWIDSGEEKYKDWYYEGEYPEKVAAILKANKKRFWAGDNISEFLNNTDQLIEDLVPRFESVLRGLVIDIDNDPNSKGTARRLAKMYVKETMSGRYDEGPHPTAFPNEGEEAYEGMLVVRSELRSMCSHHHQPVTGVAYIGIIPNGKVIGLSKYTRIAQWCARRGTLQEALANDIANEIQKVTGAKNLGVYIQATHGCCENRGIMAHSSLTQTTVLRGSFKDSQGTKKEFFDNIKLQQEFAPR